MTSEVKPGVDCPACGSNKTDVDVYGFEGFCHDCGFVIRDWNNPKIPDWKIGAKPDEETDTPDWLSFCTIRDSTEEQLALAFDCIEKLSSEFTISRSIREKAAKTYCEAFSFGTTNGRKTDCLVAACLATASQDAHEPIPTSRLVQTASVTKKAFKSSQRALRDDLDMRVRSSSSKEYLPFLSRELRIPNHDYASASDLIDELSDRLKFTGKSPIGIASAAVYLTSDYTQQQVADAAGVSSETVRQRVNDINEIGLL